MVFVQENDPSIAAMKWEESSRANESTRIREVA